jgi:hypothetical protein
MHRCEALKELLCACWCFLFCLDIRADPAIGWERTRCFQSWICFFFLENGGVYNTYILHLLPLTCLYTHCIYSVFCPSYLLIDVVKSIHFHLPICALLLLHWAWCTRSPSLGIHQEDSAVSLEAEWFLMRAPSSVKQISVYTLHDRRWCMLLQSRTNMDM